MRSGCLYRTPQNQVIGDGLNPNLLRGGRSPCVPGIYQAKETPRRLVLSSETKVPRDLPPPQVQDARTQLPLRGVTITVSVPYGNSDRSGAPAPNRRKTDEEGRCFVIFAGQREQTCYWPHALISWPRVLAFVPSHSFVFKASVD